VFLKKKKKFQNKPLLRAHSDDTVSSICYTRNSVMADKPRRICAICNGLADPLKSPSRTCTFCDFGCSASQGVDISRRTPETGARVGLGHACPLTNTPLPTWITMPNLIAVDQMVRSYVWRSARKVSFSRHAFQGHSRSSDLTRIDRYL